MWFRFNAALRSSGESFRMEKICCNMLSTYLTAALRQWIEIGIILTAYKFDICDVPFIRKESQIIIKKFKIVIVERE